MRAMLHYAFLKNARDRAMWSLLLGPLVLIGAPLLGFMGAASITGQQVHPVALQGTSVAASEVMFIFVATLAAVAAAGTAAFWCFRSDIANRSLAFMLLALRRPVFAALAAVVFGWCAGIAAMALMIPMIGAATAVVSRAWLPAIAIVAIGAAVSAAAGVLFATYSQAPGTLVMVAFIGSVIAFGTASGLDSRPLPAIAIAIALTGLLVTIAGRAMEWRCAA